MMATSNRASCVLLPLIFVALQGFEAQGSLEVTGYLGQDVTLPCHFCQTTEASITSITQVQWDLLQPNGTKTPIVVLNSELGENVFNSSLNGRIIISKQSLIIKNVEITDAGLYTCKLSTFPQGAIEEKTKLIVQEQVPLSSGILAVIVMTVVLLLVILTAVLYLYAAKKCNSGIRHHVVVETDNPWINMGRPSVIVRDEEVLYSDVTVKPYRVGAPSSDERRASDHVLYSEVLIRAQQAR